eukprot:CAMPEP_0170482056 /NCGR_PEP_ID=MMETSP0208-20121228/2243_1 /TAXON_ID=197538 /ORGANISM="Strombidium inclinatum, Strain S3" /LENGTH=188 /DNA_ID=CAMNT_0010754851 /DNA_START=1942 /DNA_END=2508 /DNA_ORIENTATION=-
MAPQNPVESEHKLVHTLHQSSVKAMESEYSSSLKCLLFPLKVMLPPNKSRILYFRTESIQNEWLKLLDKVVNSESMNIGNYYDIDDHTPLGKGQFGVILPGKNKASAKEVAVKQIKKSDMTPQEIQQLRREIEVLKVAEHSSIVGLLDLFENHHYSYIVLEKLKGGDLFDYMKARNFKLEEGRVKEMA